MAPLVIDVCARRELNPIPFLLALACASNVGSAATLIGNPQNMLIGQTLQLSFVEYLIDAGLPAVTGLGVVWVVVWLAYRRHWGEAENAYEPGSKAARRAEKIQRRLQYQSAPRTSVAALPPVAFDRWQTLKGTVVITLTMLAFLFTDWPRDVVALGAAGALLVSRKMASREMLSQIDWPLLVLFIGLFIVNQAIAQSGLVHGMLSMSRMAGLDWTSPATLFAGTAVLSNIVSNVPAVMLLLPAARDEVAGAVLALSSTFAGNLLIVGSIANLIVIDQAARLGLVIDWKAHARVGIPVTLVTLAIAAVWVLVVRG
jgi:Na+/H+ antiporter NhaD/arsenite permease-like protein